MTRRNSIDCSNVDADAIPDAARLDTQRDSKRTSRRLAILPVTCALLLTIWGVAYAHATLVSAEPAAGSHASVGLSRIRLVFSEPVEPALARIALHGSSSGVERLEPSADPHDVHALIAPVSLPAAGAYRVEWRVVSADGHPVAGSYAFWVGAASPPSPPALDADSAATWGPTIVGAPLVPAIMRGAALFSLMALGGMLFFLAWCGEGAEPRANRFAIALGVGTTMLVVLYSTAWLINSSPEHSIAGDTASSMLATGMGRVEVARLAFVVMSLWALWLARRIGLALFFAICALLISGASGHSAAIHQLWATPAKSLHLLSGAAWLGGLLWLALRLGEARVRDATFLRDVRRVSSVALWAVVIVTGSGAVQLLLFLAHPLDLFRSAYGAVALAKIAGVLVLVGYGAYHRYRVLPHIMAGSGEDGTFGRTLRHEVSVVAFVAIAGGLLAYLPPRSSGDMEMHGTHARSEMPGKSDVMRDSSATNTLTTNRTKDAQR